MKASTIAIKSALTVAKDKRTQWLHAHHAGELTRIELIQLLTEQINSFKSLSQKAETPTAHGWINNLIYADRKILERLGG